MISPDRCISVPLAERIALKIRGIMLWVAALLASIIWVLGLASGFLGFGIHIFLLAALLAVLAALLPAAHDADPAAQPETGFSNASSMPAVKEARSLASGTAPDDEHDTA